MSNPDGKNCLKCAQRDGRICKIRKVRCTRAVSADCADFEHYLLKRFEERLNLPDGQENF